MNRNIISSKSLNKTVCETQKQIDDIRRMNIQLQKLPIKFQIRRELKYLETRLREIRKKYVQEWKNIENVKKKYHDEIREMN